MASSMHGGRIGEEEKAQQVTGASHSEEARDHRSLALLRVFWCFEADIEEKGWGEGGNKWLDALILVVGSAPPHQRHISWGTFCAIVPQGRMAARIGPRSQGNPPCGIRAAKAELACCHQPLVRLYGVGERSFFQIVREVGMCVCVGPLVGHALVQPL